MLKLQDFRKIKKITLPSYPDSEVEIYDSMLVGDMTKIKTQSDDEIKLAIDMLPYLIKSWNFTDDKDDPLPITAENLNFLKAEDLAFIFSTITTMANESKKK